MKNKILLFILLLTLVTRLYHIAFPIAGWHSWRQSDTAAIARNFATENYNIFYPKIDWRGNTAGFVESEFQLYTYTIASLYKLFGIHEMFGRLLSVFCSIGTVLGIFLLVKKIVNEQTALWSSFFYAILPLSIFYGRAFMPEQMMLMFSVFGIYFFSKWLDTQKFLFFLFSVISISLAALLKLPALYLGLPLLFLCWNKYQKALFTRPLIWIFALFVFASVGLWYYHSHQLKAMTGLSFGIWDVGVDKWGNMELLTSFKFYNDVFFKSVAERHFTYAAFIPFVAGFFVKRNSKQEFLFDFWFIAIIIYILIVAKGNNVHEYYQLPLMIPGVIFLGKTFAVYFQSHIELTSKKKNIKYFLGFCLLLTLVLSTMRLQNLFDGKRAAAPLFQLAGAVKETTTPSDLIITVSEGNPVVLYNCERKGWTCSPMQIDSFYLKQKKNEGATYLVAEKEVFVRNGLLRQIDYLTKYFTVIRNEEHYIIVKL